MKTPRFILCLACCFALAPTTPLQAEDGHDHHHDIVVARTAGNQLTVEFNFDEPVALPAVSGLFNGWAGDDPGFGHLEADEPGEGLYMLGNGASIAFQVVSFDAALVANPLTDALDAPGEQTLLGDHELHEHLGWLINADHVAFDPQQTVWHAQFQLLDLGTTGYTPSDVFTLQFTNVPEPAMILTLACAAVAMHRRRR